MNKNNPLLTNYWTIRGGCNKQRSNVGNGNSTVIKDEFAYLSYFKCNNNNLV